MAWSDNVKEVNYFSAVPELYQGESKKEMKKKGRERLN